MMHRRSLIPVATLMVCLAVWLATAWAREAADDGLARPGRADGRPRTSWMTDAKYGIFVHYQYRILLGYCIRTDPQFPQPEQMTAGQWNEFVDGFDVNGFAAQMA